MHLHRKLLFSKYDFSKMRLFCKHTFYFFHGIHNTEWSIKNIFVKINKSESVLHTFFMVIFWKLRNL